MKSSRSTGTRGSLFFLSSTTCLSSEQNCETNRGEHRQSVIHPFPRFYVIILMLQNPEVFSNSLVDASLLHPSHVSIPMLPFLFPSRIRKRSAWSPKLIPPPVTLVPAPPSCPRPRFSQDPSCFWNTAPSPRPLSFRTHPCMTYVS